MNWRVNTRFIKNMIRAPRRIVVRDRNLFRQSCVAPSVRLRLRSGSGFFIFFYYTVLFLKSYVYFIGDY